MKASRYKEFQGWKGNQDIFNKVSYFIIIIIEYWGKIVNFLRGIEVEASKMFFRSCHERGTKKKFWVLMRNQTSDLQIPRSNVLSSSLLFIFDKLTICACNSGLHWTLRPRFTVFYCDKEKNKNSGKCKQGNTSKSLMMISWISDRGGFQQFIALFFFLLLLLVFFL